MAIVLLGEGFAFACEGGAASVEAVGVVNSFAAGLNTGLLVCGGYEKGSRGGFTVSLSQLIQRGTIMLVKVRAQAMEYQSV